MNANLLSSLEQQSAELEAAVKDDLERHTDDELAELVRQHLQNPCCVVALALTKNPGKFAAMAAIPIQRERLRRAEIAAMETI